MNAHRRRLLSAGHSPAESRVAAVIRFSRSGEVKGADRRAVVTYCRVSGDSQQRAVWSRQRQRAA